MFFGKVNGEDVCAKITSNQILVFAKSLNEFRICNKELHDRVFDLALTNIPEGPFRVQYLNYLLYCSSVLPDSRNYELMRQAIFKSGVIYEQRNNFHV